MPQQRPKVDPDAALLQQQQQQQQLLLRDVTFGSKRASPSHDSGSCTCWVGEC